MIVYALVHVQITHDSMARCSCALVLSSYQFFCHPKPTILDKSTTVASFLVSHTIPLCLTDV